jgi:hypothetical protein
MRDNGRLVESSGWTKVEAGCPVEALLIDDGVQFEFGRRSELFLIFAEPALREFVQLAQRSLKACEGEIVAEAG